MTGQWQIFSNVIGGSKVYQVGRVLDTSEPVHSGNVEYAGGVFVDKALAENYIEDLKKWEEKE